MTFTELFLVIKYMDSFVRTHENLQEVIREAFFVQLAVSWYCFRINPSRHLIVQVNNGNTRTMCEVCSKLTIKTLERRHWHALLLFPLLTLDKYMPAGNWNFHHETISVLIRHYLEGYLRTKNTNYWNEFKLMWSQGEPYTLKNWNYC